MSNLPAPATRQPVKPEQWDAAFNARETHLDEHNSKKSFISRHDFEDTHVLSRVYAWRYWIDDNGYMWRESVMVVDYLMGRMVV